MQCSRNLALRHLRRKAEGAKSSYFAMILPEDEGEKRPSAS
jgi:hypothetical protein